MVGGSVQVLELRCSFAEVWFSGFQSSRQEELDNCCEERGYDPVRGWALSNDCKLSLGSGCLAGRGVRIALELRRFCASFALFAILGCIRIACNSACVAGASFSSKLGAHEANRTASETHASETCGNKGSTGPNPGLVGRPSFFPRPGDTWIPNTAFVFPGTSEYLGSGCSLVCWVREIASYDACIADLCLRSISYALGSQLVALSAS
jgi:hypothetical protein